MKTTETQIAQHTPGPWELSGRAIYSPSDWKDGRNNGSFYVAQCFAEADRSLPELAPMLEGSTVVENDCIASSNARLIAAAPDLLEALKNAVQFHFGTKGLNDPNHLVGWVRVANRAIAKAESRA